MFSMMKLLISSVIIFCNNKKGINCVVVCLIPTLNIVPIVPFKVYP